MGFLHSRLKLDELDVGIQLAHFTGLYFHIFTIFWTQSWRHLLGFVPGSPYYICPVLQLTTGQILRLQSSIVCVLQVIYMARNPKDLVVSYYQFHRSLRTMSYRGTFQEFCRRFMNDKCKWINLWIGISSGFAPSCVCALLFPHSGIRLLVRTRARILGTPHGLKRPLSEVWRHVQGEF